MLDVEAALARRGEAGQIPQSAVAPISAARVAARYDAGDLGRQAAPAGNTAPFPWSRP
jgi:adenylosuccinate lyase